MVRAMFTASDKDGDLSLNKEEVVSFTHPGIDSDVEEAVAKVELQLKDKNGDGKLSLEEFAGEKFSGGQDVFKRLDINHDGFMDLKEFSVYESGRFFEEDGLSTLIDNADADKDGFVTLQELLDSRQQEAD